MRIATLGPRGTYSEVASRLYAGQNGVEHPDIKFMATTVALNRVQRREADIAVIPLENTVDGLIGATLDALIDNHDFVKVCDEVSIPIRHLLVARSHIDPCSVRVVYSHSSALNQCAAKLSEVAPHPELVPVNSTAQAAEIVRMSKHEDACAAICSENAMIDHQLVVLEPDIQDYDVNMTRFAVCALTDSPPTGHDKTMVAVRPGQDRPGLLYSILGELAINSVNLSFIQSRPHKIRPREYIFVFEMEGHKIESRVEKALAGVDRLVKATGGWRKILGSYPRRECET